MLSPLLRPCILEMGGGPVSFLTSLGPSSRREAPSSSLGSRLGAHCACADRKSLRGRAPAPWHSNPIHSEKWKLPHLCLLYRALGLNLLLNSDGLWERISSSLVVGVPNSRTGLRVSIPRVAENMKRDNLCCRTSFWLLFQRALLREAVSGLPFLLKQWPRHSPFLFLCSVFLQSKLQTLLIVCLSVSLLEWKLLESGTIHPFPWLWSPRARALRDTQLE